MGSPVKVSDTEAAYRPRAAHRAADHERFITVWTHTNSGPEQEAATILTARDRQRAFNPHCERANQAFSQPTLANSVYSRARSRFVTSDSSGGIA